MEETHFIQFSGKANLPEPLKLGNAYTAEIQGEIVDIKRALYEDNGVTVTYKFNPLTANIKNELGEVTKAKDTRKRSQQLRAVLFKIYKDDDNEDLDFEKVYDRFMLNIIKNAQTLYDKSKVIHI